MKTTFYTLIFLLTSAFSGINAQSFSLQTYTGIPVNNGDTILLSSGTLFSSLSDQLMVFNNSGTTKSVVASKTYLNVLPGTFDVFSFDTYCCLAPTIFIIPGTVVMTPGGGPKMFTCQYQDFGIPGSSYIRYSFYDELNPSDRVEVVYHFEVGQPTGITNLTDATEIKVYPNPTNGPVNINVSNENYTKLKADIFNAEGQIILTQALTDKSVFVADLNAQPKGTYIIRIITPDNRILNNFKIIRD